MKSAIQPIDRILRGSTRVVSQEELRKKLEKGKPLRVKLGVDPTAADLHLGHTVLLEKLKVFQDLGHVVVFIIGDFTARVGDPSGRDSTRPVLTEEEINANITTYKTQVFKILDESKTEVRSNGEWLYDLFNRTHPRFLLRSLLRNHTVQQLMERDDFAQRRKAGEPITVLELLYPLFQGFDSVAVNADVELGGNDQLFNLLMGRELQRDAKREPQVVLTMPLLEGLDGVRKMSKTYGNHIGVNEPAKEMFGKLMSVSDALMWRYYDLLTEEDLGEAKSLHPKEAKMNLAQLITARYHGEGAAKAERDSFARVFSDKGVPDRLENFQLPQGGIDVVELLVKAELVLSKKEARRLVEQGGVHLNKATLELGKKIILKEPAILKVGKRRFKKLIPA